MQTERRGPQVLVRPVQARLERFGGKAMAVRRGMKHPARLEGVTETGNDVTLKISEADLAEKAPGRAVLDQPVAKAEERPETGIAQHSCPGFLACRRHAGDVSGHRRDGPHGGGGIEICRRMTAQREPRGGKNGDERTHAGYRMNLLRSALAARSAT